MHNTRYVADLGASLIQLMSFLNSPQRDDALLREAGVDLDRALFPLLVRLAAACPLSVVELADQVGRDHTTVSRQLSKLERLGLISRSSPGADRRVRAAALTPEGERIVAAITGARRRLLSRALAVWSEDDLAQLSRLNQRFVETLAAAFDAKG